MDARVTAIRGEPVSAGWHWPLGWLLVIIVLIRLVGIDQPIVEVMTVNRITGRSPGIVT